MVNLAMRGAQNGEGQSSKWLALSLWSGNPIYSVPFLPWSQLLPYLCFTLPYQGVFFFMNRIDNPPRYSIIRLHLTTTPIITLPHAFHFLSPLLHRRITLVKTMCKNASGAQKRQRKKEKGDCPAGCEISKTWQLYVRQTPCWWSVNKY